MSNSTTSRRRTSPERIAARNERIRQADAERTAREQRRAAIAEYFAADSDETPAAPLQTADMWATDYVEKHPELVEGNCPTCGAAGEQSCMTRAGKPTKRHATRP